MAILILLSFLHVVGYIAKRDLCRNYRLEIAFAAAGHVWTVALCQADSDGDGASNGAELGDPTCVWTAGGSPTGSATGHPGICNPLGSCATEAFSCNCHGHSCVGK